MTAITTLYIILAVYLLLAMRERASFGEDWDLKPRCVTVPSSAPNSTDAKAVEEVIQRHLAQVIIEAYKRWK